MSKASWYLSALIGLDGRARDIRVIKSHALSADWRRRFEAVQILDFRSGKIRGWETNRKSITPIEVTFKCQGCPTYAFFFRSASTSFATSFSVSKTPCPVTATASIEGSPFTLSCFCNSSTGKTFGRSRLFNCNT